MGRVRSLSCEGLHMFNSSLGVGSSSSVSRSVMRDCLNFLFRSGDDDLLDELLRLCRASSKYLLCNFRDLDIGVYVDQFVMNIILLILKSPKCEKKVAKYHEARKSYKLYVRLALNSLRDGDHNTCWLLREALSHHAIKSLCLNVESDAELFRLTEARHGKYNSCYARHMNEVLSIDKSTEFVPIVPVLHMHSRRTNAYLKASSELPDAPKSLHSKLSLKLLDIEKAIEKYSVVCLGSASDELMPLYIDSVKLPESVVKNPLHKRYRQGSKVSFSDLLNLNKMVLKSRPLNFSIGKVKGWRKKSGYHLGLKYSKSGILKD